MCCQLQQQCLTKEHVDSFKQQMVDVIRYTKEHPDSINHLAVNDDDESGLLACSLSDVIDGDGATHTSMSVDVTRVSSSQMISITLSVATASDGVSHAADNVSQQTTVSSAGAQMFPPTDVRTPTGSLNVELSSDAEYYTPLGSPDESRQSSAANRVIHIDDLNTATSLPPADIGILVSSSISLLG